MNSNTSQLAATDAPKAVLQNGHAIRVIRTLLGWTPDDLARSVKVTTPSIRNYELEHRNCPEVVLAKIANALNVDVRAIARRPLYSEAEDAA